jgi:hypothetical protein
LKVQFVRLGGQSIVDCIIYEGLHGFGGGWSENTFETFLASRSDQHAGCALA